MKFRINPTFVGYAVGVSIVILAVLAFVTFCQPS